MQEWIRVDDKLPDEFERVLGIVEYDFESRHYRNIMIVYRYCKRWEPLGRETDSVTYWMPLPEMPDVQ